MGGGARRVYAGGRVPSEHTGGGGRRACVQVGVFRVHGAHGGEGHRACVQAGMFRLHGAGPEDRGLARGWSRERQAPA